MNPSIYHSALIVSGLLALSNHLIWAIHPELGGLNWANPFSKRPHLSEGSSETQTKAPIFAANLYGDDSGTPAITQTNPTSAPNRHAHDILIDHLTQLEPSQLAKTISSKLTEMLRRFVACRPNRPILLLNCSSEMEATTVSNVVEPLDDT